MRVLYHFKRTTIVSSLPDVLLYALPYIFYEISTYLYFDNMYSNVYGDVWQPNVTRSKKSQGI